MKSIKPFVARSLTICLSLLLLLGSPGAVFASETASPSAAPTSESPAPGQSDTTVPIAGVTRPTGASAATYHYNQANGLWENDYYTWNPANKETLAKTAPEYTYNPQTALWDTSIWEYQTASNQYISVLHSVATPPAGSITHGGPVVSSAPTTANSASNAAVAVPSGQSATNPVNSPTTGQGSQTANTAPGNSVPAGSNLDLSNAAGVSLATSVNSAALSGDALLQSNMLAGNATSGNAAAYATVLNLLQSSSSLAGSGLTTFTKDIQGDVNGDLLIDPTALAQPANIAPTTLNNLTLHSSLDAGIQNNINLSATSGNAGVIDNTHAGNAVTGDANAVANVINMINSIVAANQSFLGVVNIYGNFSGDILVPTSSLNALLASNTDTADPTITSSTDSNQQITNNIDLAAASGNAVQDNNTHTGNAVTGDALTKLTIFNLTGRKVTAANSLLVFVNVLGTWVGVIMDAPAGATTAALTGGATPAPEMTTAPEAVAATPASGAATTDLHQTDKESIINNITAHATTGDATVQNNFSSGDAVTGSAHASANIFNMINSQFSLSNWFGILFINVFGAWHGNFGTAKPPVTLAETSASTAGITTDSVQVAKVFRFVPSGVSATPLSRTTTAGLGGTDSYDQMIDSVGQVLAAQDIVQKVAEQKKPQTAFVSKQPGYSLSALPIVLGMTGLVAVGIERVKSARGKLFRRSR